MCILLGAIFEISFDPAMDKAKDIVINNNIKLAVHGSQINDDKIWNCEFGNECGQIIELQILNDTCSWTSTNEEKCNETRCIKDDDDYAECCCIKLLADDAYKGEEYNYRINNYTSVKKNYLSGTQYEDVIKNGLLGEGKYAIMKSYLTQAELSWGERYNQGMGWHRSEDRVHGINPNRGYLTNKKWAFIEEINIFILRLSNLYLFILAN